MSAPATSVRARATTPFTVRGVVLGFAAGQALAAGVFAYGVAFGLLALGVGQGPLRALAMSVLINSGSAQTVAAGAIASGMGIATTVLAVALLNARYLLYGASLHSWLGPVGGWRAHASLFVLGDNNWLLSLAAREAGQRDAGFILGSGLANYAAWLAGTLTGALAGAWIPAPERLGLDFLLVAFCAAMAIVSFRSRPGRVSIATAIAALVGALAADALAGPGAAIVAAGLAGTLAAWIAQRHAVGTAR